MGSVSSDETEKEDTAKKSAWAWAMRKSGWDVLGEEISSPLGLLTSCAGWAHSVSASAGTGRCSGSRSDVCDSSSTRLVV